MPFIVNGLILFLYRYYNQLAPLARKIFINKKHQDVGHISFILMITMHRVHGVCPHAPCLYEISLRMKASGHVPIRNRDTTRRNSSILCSGTARRADLYFKSFKGLILAAQFSYHPDSDSRFLFRRSIASSA
jgi:hypothetical protein